MTDVERVILDYLVGILLASVGLTCLVVRMLRTQQELLEWVLANHQMWHELLGEKSEPQEQVKKGDQRAKAKEQYR